MNNRILSGLPAVFLAAAVLCAAQPVRPQLIPNLFSAVQNYPPPPPPPPPPSPEAEAWAKKETVRLSLALIDKLQKLFEEAAASGTNEWGKIVGSLEGLMREARTARDGQQIEEPFFARYRRLIRVIKMSMMDDPERILQPVFLKEMGAFVEDILGKAVAKSETEPGIARFSDACATEMTRLRLELIGGGKSKTGR